MQTQAFFFFFFGRGGEFKSALIIDAIYKDKQEIIVLISCFSLAALEIGDLIFIEEEPGKQITKGRKGEE